MNDVKIFKAFCCGTCKNCCAGISDGRMYCLRHREEDGSLLSVKLTDVCQWYQRKEEEA